MSPETGSGGKLKAGRKPTHNPMIRSYQKDHLLLEDGSVNLKFSEKMENLILDCMAKKCERT
jgi:hypothetical protein